MKYSKFDLIKQNLQLKSLKNTLARWLICCLALAITATIASGFVEVDTNTYELNKGLFFGDALTNDLVYFLYGFIVFLFPLIAIVHMGFRLVLNLLKIEYSGLDIISLATFVTAGLLGFEMLKGYTEEPLGIEGKAVGAGLVALPSLVGFCVALSLVVKKFLKTRKNK